jgi:hypothetical protein
LCFQEKPKASKTRIVGKRSGREKEQAMRKILMTLVLGIAVVGFSAALPSKAAAGGRLLGPAVVYTNPYMGTYYNNWGSTSFYVNPSYTASYSYPGYGTSTYVVSPARAAVSYGYPGYRYYYTPGYYYSTYVPW